MNFNVFKKCFGLITLNIICFTSGASQIPISEINFKAKTNLPSITISGKTKNAEKAKIEFDAKNKNIISTFNLEFSPNELQTGLSLRDNHMKEKIFQAADGSLPLIQFSLNKPIQLPLKDSEIDGKLSLRGVSAAFNPKCSSSLEGQKLKIDCKGMINIEKHSITPPTHLGVKVLPEVEVALATEKDLE